MSERLEKLWQKAPAGVLTSGIGSLPHPYVDAALKFSFNLTVPFLPQLPQLHEKEYMVVQALEKLPGLSVGEGGVALLDETNWLSGTEALRDQTERAFGDAGTNAEAFAAFEPSPEVWSSWTPFLWELNERKIGFAKMQLAGPLTCQWALQTKKGSTSDRNPGIGMQVFRLILARAIAMSRKMQSIGATPLFYLDEPGFYGYSQNNPQHLLGLNELKLFIQTLQKEETLVGIHCCSNTDWNAIMSLPIDVLSIDTNLSLISVLQHKGALKKFLERGGRLSLGVVPTGTHSLMIQAFKSELLFEKLLSTLHVQLVGYESLVKRILKTSLITPACGLALHSIEDAETILNYTLEVAELCGRHAG